MKSSKRMSFSVLVSTLVLIVVSLSFLYGCGSAGGGGGGGAAAPGNAGISTTTSLSGVALAPSGTSVACNPGFFPMLARFFVSGAWAISGHTPVDGATVKAYNFYTGSLLETTTTDINGNYTFTSIPMGIDILIVVEKDLSGGGKLRLTAIVPNVDVQTSITGEVDARTTLAAEQMATYFGQNLSVDPAILQTLFASADVLIAAAGGLSALDLELGHGIISGEIGSGLFPGTLTDPMIAVSPTATQMAVAVAKAMVRDIRDCGVGIGLFMSSEAERQMTAYNDVILPHLATVEAFISRDINEIMNDTMVPSLCATVNDFVSGELSLYFDSSFEGFTDYYTNTFEAFYTYVNDLQSEINDVNEAMGHVNTSTGFTSGEYTLGSTNEIISKDGDTADGTLLFHLASGKNVLVTVEAMNATEEVTDVWNIWQRASFVAWKTAYDYQGVAEIYITETPEDLYPHSIKINGYLISSLISNPVTFDVTVSETGSGTPPNYKSATSTMSGMFLSDEFSVNGTFTGNIFQDELYPAFSSLTFNGSLDTKKLHFGGALTMNGYKRYEESIPEFEVSNFSSSGYISTDALSFDGSCYADLFQNEYHGYPSYLTMQGSLRSKMINANGSLVANMTTDTFNGYKDVSPSHLVFSGILSSKVITFEGSITADRSVQAPSPTARNYPTSINLSGKFTPDVFGWNGNLNMILATELVSVESEGDTYSWITSYPKSIDFTGNLTSEVFTFNGRLGMTEQMYKLSNGYGRTAADYMMFDGKISTPVFFLSGSISGRQKNSLITTVESFWTGSEWVTFESWDFVTVPENMTMSGALSTGLVTLEFNNLSATFFQTGLLPSATNHVALQSGIFRTPTIHANGNLSCDFVVNTSRTGEAFIMPSNISFTGTYSNIDTPESTADGTITYSCANAATSTFQAPYTEANYPRVTTRYQGQIRAAGMPVAQADVTATATGPNKESYAVFYGHGLNTLTGTVAVNRNTSPTSAEANLTSQLGVTTHMVLEFADGFPSAITDCTGNIKNAGGVTLGLFDMYLGSPRVTYSDGWFETLN